MVPLDIIGIVLGSPYLYDGKVIFHHHENKYHLFKDDKEFIVRAHRKKTNIAMVNVGQVTRLVNSSKNFVLLTINPKSDVNHEPFEACDPRFKSYLYDVFNAHHDIFSHGDGIFLSCHTSKDSPTQYLLCQAEPHLIQLCQQNVQ